jgi:hypothetical protein
VVADGAVGATIGFQPLWGQFTGDEFEGTFTSFDCDWKAVLKRDRGPDWRTLAVTAPTELRFVRRQAVMGCVIAPIGDSELPAGPPTALAGNTDTNGFELGRPGGLGELCGLGNVPVGSSIVTSMRAWPLSGFALDGTTDIPRLTGLDVVNG